MEEEQEHEEEKKAVEGVEGKSRRIEREGEIGRLVN